MNMFMFRLFREEELEWSDLFPKDQMCERMFQVRGSQMW